jgi:protein involved in ribonucleotide reduction
VAVAVTTLSAPTPRFIKRLNSSSIRLKKYDHFRDKFKTTKEFIDYCASKSLLSDKPYQIKCADRAVIESRLWFLEALKKN